MVERFRGQRRTGQMHDGRPERALQTCEDDARKEEVEFVRKFSTAFQSDPTCAGLRLLVVGGPNTSEQAKHSEAELGDREHWMLFLDFSPGGLPKQSWSMSHQPHSDRWAFGQGDPSSTAHYVYEFVRNRGGLSRPLTSLRL